MRLKNIQFIIALVLATITGSTFAQQELSSSQIEQIRQNNIKNKVYEYEGLKVKYDVTFNSVKVSEEDANGVVNDLNNIQGVECKIYPESFSLIVKADKGNKYLNIVGIQDILMRHNLHIMTYTETLFQ